MRGEKQKILNAKAVLKNLYPDKKIFYYFGFPFDPLAKKDTGYDKQTYMDSIIEFNKFCDKEEVLLSDELWSFLSGESGTMQLILDIIKSIATVNFVSEFDFINDSKNVLNQPEEYCRIAKKWHLKDESIIAENLPELLGISKNLESLHRVLNKNIFNDKVEYNSNRSKTLLEQIKKIKNFS